jgi:sugar lactone lactonase YvrE
VADTKNNTIREVTVSGEVRTIAGQVGIVGNFDGLGRDAQFNSPSGVAVDDTGIVYVSDSVNNTIRKLAPLGPNWVVTTLAGKSGASGNSDGPGDMARFNYPNGLAVDHAGNLYVADTLNNRVRRVTSAGVATTLPVEISPVAIALDGAGNIYITDTSNTIEELSLNASGWVVRSLAGHAGAFGSADGAGDTARFHNPTGLALDSSGSLFVADLGNNSIRKASLFGTNWTVITWAGNVQASGSIDGTVTDARFDGPSGIVTDRAGNLYITEPRNDDIRQISPEGIVSTLAGLDSPGNTDGTGTEARFSGPAALAIDSAGNLYVADEDNHTIRMISSAGEVTTLAGLAGHPGYRDGVGTAARFNQPVSVAVDADGNVYVGECGNNTIREVSPAGVVTTLAGDPLGGHADGVGSGARFLCPHGLTVDTAGNVYVADHGNHTVRRLAPHPSYWFVSTIAGIPEASGSADGIGPAARFFWPSGLAMDSAGNLYVADYGSRTIRELKQVGTDWVVTTIAGAASTTDPDVHPTDGPGSVARFNRPNDVALDTVGRLYVADYDDHTIRRLAPSGTNWMVTTLAGLSRHPDSSDGAGNAARFFYPAGLTVDSLGNVYVADWFNNVIRHGYPAFAISPGWSFDAGRFGFTFAGPMGNTVMVETSSDLLNWQPVWTNTVSSRPEPFSDSKTLASPQRFYRARTE